MAGVALLVIGTLIRRHARRLAALDATELLRRDPRPMVLYLRTFADDSLTIRTATYARRSLIDRLSPRRFDRFEEMLVKNLTTMGPVVALNPPGIHLAPIGAARETLAAEDHWQATITDWMTNARLIVVGAAPEAISPGFEWGASRHRLSPAVAKDTACPAADTRHRDTHTMGKLRQGVHPYNHGVSPPRLRSRTHARIFWFCGRRMVSHNSGSAD